MKYDIEKRKEKKLNENYDLNMKKLMYKTK